MWCSGSWARQRHQIECKPSTSTCSLVHGPKPQAHLHLRISTPACQHKDTHVRTRAHAHTHAQHTQRWMLLAVSITMPILTYQTCQCFVHSPFLPSCGIKRLRESTGRCHTPPPTWCSCTMLMLHGKLCSIPAWKKGPVEDSLSLASVSAAPPLHLCLIHHRLGSWMSPSPKPSIAGTARH